MKGLQPEVVLLISNITKSIKDFDWHDFVTKNAWVLRERVEKKIGNSLIYKKYKDYCAPHKTSGQWAHMDGHYVKSETFLAVVHHFLGFALLCKLLNVDSSLWG